MRRVTGVKRIQSSDIRITEKRAGSLVCLPLLFVTQDSHDVSLVQEPLCEHVSLVRPALQAVPDLCYYLCDSDLAGKTGREANRKRFTMKLKNEFITHITGNESLLVPTGEADFAGLVKGNKTMGVILELLQEDTSEAEIVAAMKARFDAPEEIISRDVRKVLSELRRIGALYE